MKRFLIQCIIFLAALVFATAASAQYLMDAVKTTTYTEKIAPKQSSSSFVAKNCQVHADTPVADIVRSPWEIQLRNNIMDIPNNGRVQGHTENFDIEVVHNLSSVFGVYGWYGTRKVTKNDVPGSKYTTEWESQAALIGGFLYVQPTIRIFAAAGKIWLDNENGSPNLDTAVEKGIAFDYPIGDYKISLTYKIVEAQLKDTKDVSEITGDGGYSSAAIGIVIPLNYGHGVSE